MGSKAAAQTINPCLTPTIWYFPDPIPMGWWIYGPGQGPYSYLIAAYNASPSCAPPPQQQPCHKCQAGQPIQLASGNTYIDQTDISLPGLGGGLTLRRRWNSAWPSNQIATSIGIFGSRWRSTYEERVFIDSNNWVTYLASDGSYSPYALYSQGIGNFWTTFQNRGNLTFAAYTSITFPSGEQRNFDPLTGALVAIIDRNGNVTQISYDANGRLSTVRDPASRHLYFNYPSGSNLVSSVTSDFGVNLSYTYDSQGRLTQITKPDLTTITLTYDAQSNITAVTDQNGKILESHTYNANGQGLTSSQANGVNALTVTYP